MRARARARERDRMGRGPWSGRGEDASARAHNACPETGGRARADPGGRANRALLEVRDPGRHGLLGRTLRRHHREGPRGRTSRWRRAVWRARRRRVRGRGVRKSSTRAPTVTTTRDDEPRACVDDLTRHVDPLRGTPRGDGDLVVSRARAGAASPGAPAGAPHARRRGGGRRHGHAASRHRASSDVLVRSRRPVERLRRRRAGRRERARARAASGRETRFDHPPSSRLGGGPVTPIAERARRPATARAPSSVSRCRRDVHDRAPRAARTPARNPAPRATLAPPPSSASPASIAPSARSRRPSRARLARDQTPPPSVDHATI